LKNITRRAHRVAWPPSEGEGGERGQESGGGAGERRGAREKAAAARVRDVRAAQRWVFSEKPSA